MLEIRKLVLRAIPLVLMGFLPVLAADRHVYLDSNGNGQLNDCPNPAHNAKGTSNTDELSYCMGGTLDRRIIGTASGRVGSSACTAAGGTATAVTSGASADVDGDATAESIYGHPQACVYFMAKSDSCDVHAGTYRRPGAQCTANCGDFSRGEVAQGTCTEWNCYLASVLAFGYGPNLDGTGYGTRAAPGYLRGAAMAGSTDTWDSDGDKIPDTEPGEPTSYPAALSGDRDGDGTFDVTSCSSSSCSGDAFFMIQIGCGANGSGSFGINCSNIFTSTEKGSILDTDADGTFDTEIGRQGSKEVDHLIVKDLEFTGYNGGNGSTIQAARHKEGHINLNGDGSTNGLVLDHLDIHANDYKAGGGSDETFWALIADMKNAGCTNPHYSETKNSFIEQNNQLIWENEGGVGDKLGCAFNVHDNRILVNITSPRSGRGGPADAPANVIFYLKSIDTLIDNTPKIHRFWNNEVIYRNGGIGKSWFMDLQAFGNASGQGMGEIWVYGNLLRNDPAVANKLQFFFPIYCSYPSADQSWRWYYFNNTWDGWNSTSSVNLEDVCNSQGGELYVGKNNVEVFTTSEQITTAATVRVSNNTSTDASKCSGTSQYFACGANPTTYTGIGYYGAKSGGALDGHGICDPDGDGVAGVDYNADGTNDTAWRDLAGSLVSCPNVNSPIDIGAIQTAGAPDTTPPGDVNGLRRTDTR